MRKKRPETIIQNKKKRLVKKRIRFKTAAEKRR